MAALCRRLRSAVKHGEAVITFGDSARIGLGGGWLWAGGRAGGRAGGQEARWAVGQPDRHAALAACLPGQPAILIHPHLAAWPTPRPDQACPV